MWPSLQSMKNPLAKQRKACTPISHPFDQLELIHFSLNHNVARHSAICEAASWALLGPAFSLHDAVKRDERVNDEFSHGFATLYSLIQLPISFTTSSAT